MSNKHIVSEKDILHLADLAKLSLTHEEIELYKSQFGETIDYIKNLDELDTGNVRPTNSVVDLKNVTYNDGTKSKTSLTIKEALRNANKTKGNEFVVDRIME